MLFRSPPPRYKILQNYIPAPLEMVTLRHDGRILSQNIRGRTIFKVCKIPFRTVSLVTTRPIWDEQDDIYSFLVSNLQTMIFLLSQIDRSEERRVG